MKFTIKCFLSVILITGIMAACNESGTQKKVPLKKALNYFNGGNKHNGKELKGGDVSMLASDLSNVRTIKISIDQLTGRISLSEVLNLKKASFTKLETNSRVLIGTIDKVMFDDKKIFVVDKHVAQKIFIYDRDGTYLSMISKMGKGPAEYLEIRDVALDKIKKRIILLDLKGRKLDFYNYNGEYLSSEKMHYFYSALAVIDDEALAYSTATAYNVHIPQIDNHYLVVGAQDGTLFSKGFHFDESDKDFSYFNPWPLRVFGSKVYFNPRYTDTIFSITKDKARAEFCLDFQGSGFSASERKGLSDETFKKLKRTKNYFAGDFIISKDWAYFNISNSKGGTTPLFYSLGTGDIICGNQFTQGDPIQLLFKTPIAEVENSLVIVLQPQEILQLKNLLIKEKINREKYDDLFTVKESDNPVLLYMPFK